VSKRTTFLLGIGVIAALVIGWQIAAFAVHDTNMFELDGNATNGAAAGDDWDNVCKQVTVTKDDPDGDPTTNDGIIPDECASASDTTGASDVAWVAESDRSASIFTGGGSKDPDDIDQWAWKDGAGGLPDKDNLLHAFAARYPSTPEGDVLFFGSDRYDNSGDAHQAFWFFQNEISLGDQPVGGGTSFNGLHAPGDLLVISNFSNGGTTSTITVYEWDPTVSGNLKQLASSNAANCANPNPAPTLDRFCGIVNPNTIQMPWTFLDKSGTTVPDGPDPGTAPDPNGALQGEFFEGGVNLTALNLADRCFASVASETRSSTSTTATLKDFVLGGFGECDTTVTTQQSVTGPTDPTSGYPTTSIGNGSVSVSDSATVKVGGISNWEGTVQFSLKGPIGSPLETTQDIGTPVAVSSSTLNGTVTSDSAHVTAVGDYCWSASLTSDTEGVPDGVDDGTNECFTVKPVEPALPTTAGPDVVLGNAVTDTATLSGTANQPATPAIQYPTTTPPTLGPKAGGTITFTLLKDDCSTLATGTGDNPQTVPVDGNGNYGPVSFTPDAVGTYHWKAEYDPAAGDPNNLASTHNGDCSDSDETVVVRQVQPTISTAQNWLPNDSATITADGGGALDGTVRFRLYDNATCEGDPLYDSNDANGDPTITVSGNSPQTVNSANTTALTDSAEVSWLVEYTSNNQAQTGATSTCNTEYSSLTIDNDTTQP
jgi:hypothetical protein